MSIDAAGNYANQYVRPAADLMAQEYNRGVQLVTQWNSLGGGANATQVMANTLQQYALKMVANHQALWGFENWWDGLGTTLISAGTTPLNDGSGPVASGGDGRQQINGNQVLSLITDLRSRVNWLAISTSTANWATTTPLPSGGSFLNTVIACANSPTTTNCGTLINRITELQTQYQASTNAVINAIQQVSVNDT